MAYNIGPRVFAMKSICVIMEKVRVFVYVDTSMYYLLVMIRAYLRLGSLAIYLACFRAEIMCIFQRNIALHEFIVDL